MTIFRMKILARSQRTGSSFWNFGSTARRNAAERKRDIRARVFFPLPRTLFLPIFPTTNSRTISRFLSSRRTPTIDRKRVTLNLKVHARTPVHARVHVFFFLDRARHSSHPMCVRTKSTTPAHGLHIAHTGYTHLLYGVLNVFSRPRQSSAFLSSTSVLGRRAPFFHEEHRAAGSNSLTATT